MIKQKMYSYPLLLIGIILVFLGSRWMLVSEPWMLDEVANVERLAMTFDELFSSEINLTLPGYLAQIYRFFGFWVIIIGLFITFLPFACTNNCTKTTMSIFKYLFCFKSLNFIVY